MIKNKDITPILSVLLFFDKDSRLEKGGLLTEEISLGLRRHLQKIRKEILAHHESINKDIEEVFDTISKKAIVSLPTEITEAQYKDDKSEHHAAYLEAINVLQVEQSKEVDELLEEEFKLTSQPASLELILKINTKANYDLDMIEKFAQ
jgi:RNAse (barnase) inhibitor barstar